MSKITFMYIFNQLKYTFNVADTMRKAIPVEKRIAVALWRLSTNVEYRTIGHVFGISRSTMCVIVHEIFNKVLTPMYMYIKIPTGQQQRETVDLFENKWVLPFYIMCGRNRWQP